MTETPPYAEYYCPDCGWAFSVHERDDDGRKLCPEDDE